MTDVKRWLQALIWAAVAVLVVAELIDGLEVSRRRVAQAVTARWSRFERNERRRARRSEMAALASRLRPGHDRR